MIRDDRVDILVDTTLHMEGNRLLVFARKPAPVQVTFAGYPGSTGLEAIDYRLTDVHLDPPGQGDDAYVERSWRLPHTFWCYDPLDFDVAVNDSARGCQRPRHLRLHEQFFEDQRGRVARVGAACCARYADSRLLVLAHEGSHRARALQLLNSLGVEPRRIEFAAYRPRSGLSGVVQSHRHQPGYRPVQWAHHRARFALDGRARRDAGRRDGGGPRGLEPADEPGPYRN